MATILIVEDSPDNMKLLRTLLTLRKHEVVALTSGEGLLQAVGKNHPALVLMDIQLPGKDGYALLNPARGCSPVAPRCSVGAHSPTASGRSNPSSPMTPPVNPTSDFAMHTLVGSFTYRPNRSTRR